MTLKLHLHMCVCLNFSDIYVCVCICVCMYFKIPFLYNFLTCCQANCHLIWGCLSLQILLQVFVFLRIGDSNTVVLQICFRRGTV